jgi:hypothetical protein
LLTLLIPSDQELPGQWISSVTSHCWH